MQNIDVFWFLQHDTQCKQPTTLNSQFEDTIVTGTLLIYYKDAIKKKNMQFVSFHLEFFLDLVHSQIFL